MTDQLGGRALDEACARAMGWTVRPDEYGPIQFQGPEMPEEPDWERAWPLRSYSTDPATLDEKLAWLLKTTTLGVHITVDPAPAGAHAEAENPAHGQGPSDKPVFLEAHGATIHEALARLVVAVAEARKA